MLLTKKNFLIIINIKGLVPPFKGILQINMKQKKAVNLGKKPNLEKELKVDMEIIFNKTNTKTCNTTSGH